MKIYLAEPIDYPGSVSWRQTGSSLAECLIEDGHELFRPAHFWRLHGMAFKPVMSDQIYSAEQVAMRNWGELERADVVVAHLPAVPTVGVPMEIYRASQLGKRVLVFGMGYRSVMLETLPGVQVCGTIGEIRRELNGGDSKPVPGTHVMFATESFMERPYQGDCGLDLVTVEQTEIEPGGTANIGCGVAVALPPGTFGWIVSRSSTWTRYGLMVIPGIIDEGWRGPLRTLVHRPMNHSTDTIVVPAGTRLAQLLVLPNLVRGLAVEVVDELPPGERGERGFGSSGT